MKKYIILLFLFVGFLPRFEHGVLTIDVGTTVYAQYYAHEDDDYRCSHCGSYSCDGSCTINGGCYLCGSYSCNGSCADSGCKYCGSKNCFGGCSVNQGCYFCGSYFCNGSCADPGCKYCGSKNCFGGCNVNQGCYICGSFYCDGSCIDPGCKYCGSKNCFGACRSVCPSCGKNTCPGNCVSYKCSRCGLLSCSGNCQMPICPCCLKEICACNKCSACGKIVQGAQTRGAFSVCEICTSKKCPICNERHCKEIHDECDSIPNADTIKLGAKSLYDALKGVTYVYGEDAVPYSEFEKLLQTNGSNENSVTLFYYSDENKYLLKHLTAGKSPYGIDVYGGNSSAVATLHTHPNGTPPSGVDLITAAQNANDNPTFSSCYVHTEHGMYSLIIEDRAKAMAFYEAYKESKASPGDSFMFKKDSELDKIWNDSYETLDAFEGNDRHLLALADLLRISNSGISVVRSAKLSSEFEVVSTRIKDEKIVPIKCK